MHGRVLQRKNELVGKLLDVGSTQELVFGIYLLRIGEIGTLFLIHGLYGRDRKSVV